MNLFKIESPFRRSKKSQDPTEKTRAIAERLYRNRKLTKRFGDADSDWTKAERILKSPIRRFLFRLNQPLIRAEKGAVEPVANWVEQADLFRIIERLSPTIEAFGVIMGAIAIPLVLYFAAQNYEERQQQQELERVQQQAVTDYLNQLSTILLDLDGSLRDPQNSELRTLTTATTLTLLRDPNLDGARKGQVIEFLSQMELVQREVVYGPKPEETIPKPEETIPIINLSRADLRGADLRGADLSRADLSEAYLSEADLSWASLSGADLRWAKNLTQSQLENAYLCETQLPEGITLDPNRNCGEEWEPFG